MTCGPIGLSCDLKALSPWAKDNIRNFIAKAKENHAFWMEAVARILVNTPSVTVYQYSDMDLCRLEIQVVTLETLQHTIRVYPVVKEDKNYLVNGKDVISGAEIAREGISVDIPDRFEMFRVTLEETE